MKINIFSTFVAAGSLRKLNKKTCHKQAVFNVSISVIGRHGIVWKRKCLDFAGYNNSVKWYYPENCQIMLKTIKMAITSLSFKLSSFVNTLFQYKIILDKVQKCKWAGQFFKHFHVKIFSIMMRTVIKSVWKLLIGSKWWKNIYKRTPNRSIYYIYLSVLHYSRVTSLIKVCIIWDNASNCFLSFCFSLELLSLEFLSQCYYFGCRFARSQATL